jgi:hypothetical protein
MRYRYMDENRDWRSHLLLQRPAQDEAALSGVGHHPEPAEYIRGNRRKLDGTRCQQEHRGDCLKILITGICGFVGSSLAEGLLERREGISILGIDNLMRPGSELNRARLQQLGVALVHGDIRLPSDLEALPARGLGDRRGSESERPRRHPNWF